MGRKFQTGLCFIFGIIILFFVGCKKQTSVHTAFYYWKTSFELNPHQAILLKNAASNRLYLRLFDVVWNKELNGAFPNAILTLRHSLKGMTICPVIYITNKTFEHTNFASADSLAFKVNRLTSQLANKYHIGYQQIQIDCDWTKGTRNSYFQFLKALKKYSRKQLETTIRLHQVKYPEQTGIPPADKGLLMFYNMGKLTADLNGRNSIYNEQDAGKYVSSLTHYPLPLDVALPLFSWSVHIRSGKIIQVYGKIGMKQLSVSRNFERLTNGNTYRALKSFYLEGIYVKAGDVFKLEELTKPELIRAANQLSAYLKPLENRNIIYYEISSNNLSGLKPQDIQEVSTHF